MKKFWLRAVLLLAFVFLPGCISFGPGSPGISVSGSHGPWGTRIDARGQSGFGGDGGLFGAPPSGPICIEEDSSGKREEVTCLFSVFREPVQTGRSCNEQGWFCREVRLYKKE